MKNHKVSLILVLVLLFGVVTISEASTSHSDDYETIYTSSFTTARQPIEASSMFTHAFTSVPSEGFSNFQGTLSFTWANGPSGGSKTNKMSSDSATTFDVYVGDPDTSIQNWFQLADDAKQHAGKVSFNLTSEMLSSIFADGNGNISFAIIPSSKVFLNSGEIKVSGSAVPLPGAAWLLGSGLLGLIGFRRSFHA